MPSSGVQTCARSEEHTSELQSHDNIVCRLLLEKKDTTIAWARELARAQWPWERSTRNGARRGRATAHRVLARGNTDAPFLPVGLFFFLNKRAPPGSFPLPHPAALPV